jgi:hypothetical protein
MAVFWNVARVAWEKFAKVADLLAASIIRYMSKPRARTWF